MRSTARLAATPALTMPAAIMGGRVRAEIGTPRGVVAGSAIMAQARAAAAGVPTDPAAAFGELNDRISAFITKHENRYNEIEAHINEQAKADAVSRLGGGGNSNLFPHDADYSKAFASFTRNGGQEDALRAANATGDRARIQAAMSTGSNPDGGYLAPVEWDRNIQQAQVAVSPMRQVAQVRTTAVGAFSTLWNDNVWGSGWVGETASRPATTGTALHSLTFAAGEIFANVAVTQRLLDDSQINMDSWLIGQITTEFEKQEGIAFVSGDGQNKPWGFLQYAVGGGAAAVHPGGPLDTVPSGAADGLTVDGLVDFMYGLAAPYRQNGSWYMSSLTAAAISKMKDGQGNLIWRESFIVGQPATLLGRPVVLDENMPPIAAGSLPIAFGDFRAGYLINDRLGVRILRDPYTNKPFVMFYVTKRLGAGVLDPRAIRVMKIAVAS